MVIPIAIGDRHTVKKKEIKRYSFLIEMIADMVKLVDMPDLGSGAARRVGSSPSIRTKE
ncbi:MAG: hypothetical protein K0R65_635 [Crocinitomicaceae bacterium]|nr:hypothetical protein [Crocinitomicaceae bacterium]